MLTARRFRVGASVFVVTSFVATSPADRPLRAEVGALEKVQAEHGVDLKRAFSRLPLAFEKNQGQSDARVNFRAKGRGYTLFLSQGGDAVLSLDDRGSGG